MRILIVGNRSHQFITGYVKTLRESLCINGDIIVDVLSQESRKEMYLTDSIYDNIFDLAMPSFLCKIRIIRGAFKQLMFRYQLIKLSKIQYDIVHIHYIEDILKRDALFFLKKIKGKLIISVWGSDFLRATSVQIKQMIPLFIKAEKITIASSEIIEKFEQTYCKCGFGSKIENCMFGLQPIEALIRLYDSKKNDVDSKKKIGVLDRITVTVGYNASRGQQHIEVIHFIENHEPLKEYVNQIEFLLPLTYPNDLVYKKEIKDLLKNTVFHYKVIESYLSDDNVAILRDASDIFIQLQKTDMLSGSMLEHLAAGNIVITGSWLPYGLLKNWGIFYLSIDNLSGIADELYNVLSNYERLKNRTYCNFTLISEKFRWKNVISDWIKIYKE